MPPQYVYKSGWPEPPLPTKPLFKTCFQEDLEHPEVQAYVDIPTERSYTRAQVKQKALRLALGIKKAIPRSSVEGRNGKRLAIVFSSNVIEYPLVVFGCQACLTITSLASAAYTFREFIHQLVDGRPDILFVHPNLWPTAKKAIGEVAKDSKHAGWVKNMKIYSVLPRDLMNGTQDGLKSFEDLCVPDSQVGSYSGDDLPVERMNETAVICYSSGTTGLPKGVESTHRNIVETVARTEPRLPGLKSGRDSMIGILPYYHIYGVILLLGFCNFRAVTVYALPAFDPVAFLKAIEKYRVTTGFIAPPIASFFANAPMVDDYDLSSLDTIVCGGAALGPELQLKAINRLRRGGKKGPGNPIAAIVQGYGLTETTSPCISVHARDAIAKLGSIGQLYPGHEIMLVDLDDKPIELKFDKEGLTPPGELCVRGSSIMKGYWQNPKATKATFLPDGWLKTGDIARMDREAFFYIVDRLKELIKYKAFQVAPAELEVFLLTHPKVADAGVIGVKNEEQTNELPRAYIVPKEPLASDQERKVLAEELVKFIADNLANHKQLRGGVHFLEEIPKSASGKILRKDLRALVVKVDSVQKVNSKL